MEQSKLVSRNPSSQDKHQLKHIATSHQVDELINAGCDALLFVESTFWVGSPSRVALCQVNSLGQCHPIILGLSSFLFSFQLGNQTTPRRKVAQKRSDDFGHLTGRQDSCFERNCEQPLFQNGTWDQDCIDQFQAN